MLRQTILKSQNNVLKSGCFNNLAISYFFGNIERENIPYLLKKSISINEDIENSPDRM